MSLIPYGRNHNLWNAYDPFRMMDEMLYPQFITGLIIPFHYLHTAGKK